MAPSGIKMVDSRFNRLEVNESSGDQSRGSHVHTQISNTNHLKVGIDYGTSKSSASFGFHGSATSLQDLALAPYSVHDAGSNRIPTAVAALKNVDSSGNDFVELVFGAKAVEASRNRTLNFLAIYEVTKFHHLKLEESMFLSKEGTEFEMYEDVEKMQEKALKTIKDNTAICGFSDGSPTRDHVVRIWDPLLRTFQTREITEPTHIETEFLRFLLQSAVVEFAKQSKIPIAQAKLVFDNGVIAVSVPTKWGEPLQRSLRHRLHAAGYPRKTFLIPEIGSAALYHVSQSLQDSQQQRPDTPKITILGDIGGGTFDITTIYTYASDELVFKLGELFGPEGSLDGCEKLNQLFKQRLRKLLPEGARTLVRNFGGDDTDVENAVVAGFEEAKRDFDGTNSQYQIWPRINNNYLDFTQISNSDFHTNGSCIVFEPSAMKAIFKSWLEQIKMILKYFYDQIVERYTEGNRPLKIRPSIALTGWGSLPPYIQQELQRCFQDLGIPVRQLDVRSHSVVAQGNYMALQYRDDICKLRAEGTYGIRDQNGSASWVISHDSDLAEAASDTLVLRGVWNCDEPPCLPNSVHHSPRQPVRLSDDEDRDFAPGGYYEDFEENHNGPAQTELGFDVGKAENDAQDGDRYYHIELQLFQCKDPLSSPEFGTGIPFGRLEAEVPSKTHVASDCETNMDKKSKQSWFEYSVRFQLRGLFGYLILTIPYTGRFDPTRDTAQDITVEYELGDLYQLVAQDSGKEADEACARACQP